MKDYKQIAKDYALELKHSLTSERDGSLIFSDIKDAFIAGFEYAQEQFKSSHFENKLPFPESKL